MKKVLTIKKSNGSVLGIYDDTIPLKELGTLNVKRVSNIEFNNDKQGFEVIMTGDGSIPIESPLRNEAYDKEVEYVGQHLHELGEKHFGKDEDDDDKPKS